MSINRLFIVVIAFLLALLAVAIVLAIGAMTSDSDLTLLERVQFFGTAFFATGYGPAMVFALALFATVLAEAARIGNLFYCIVVGALIGLATAYSVDLSDALEDTTDIAPIGHPYILALIAGIVGGLVYWFVAERRAAKAG